MELTLLQDAKCLPEVLSAVPKTDQIRSPIYLGGTAGMRVLNVTDPTAAAQIIGNLSEALAKTPFDHSGAKTAEIVSGTTEGILGWITSNYLSNVFGTNESRPAPSGGGFGALDWGGASSQITFEVGDDGQFGPAEDMHELSLYGKKYKIFTSSHLCYGQAEAVRRYFVELIYERFLQTGRVPRTIIGAPCQPKGRRGVYTVRAKDLFGSPCTKYKDEAFMAAGEALNGNSTFTFRGQSNMR